jgi:hypothetical protein
MVTGLDAIVVGVLIGSAVSTEVIAPDLLKVVLPLCAAVLTVYVWGTRFR